MTDWLEVDGSSMAPLLKSGDCVGVEWLSVENVSRVRRGEIVIARESQGNSWILHRVIDTAPSVVVTRGDAAFSPETWAPEQVWGRIVAIRSGNSGREQRFAPNLLDRCVALMLATRAPESSYEARLRRRMALELSRLRRWVLR